MATAGPSCLGTAPIDLQEQTAKKQGKQRSMLPTDER